MAIVDKCENGRIYATQRNKFNKGAELEVLPPYSEPVVIQADELFDEHGNDIETANHAMMKLSIACDKQFPKNSIIRMKA